MKKWKNCSQDGCEAIARYSYVWPREPDRTLACPKHLHLAYSISSTMGFRLGDMKSMTLDEMTCED